MTNLIKAIEAEQKKQLTDFINEVNEATEQELCTKWYFADLLPQAKKPIYNKVLDSYTIKGIDSTTQLKAYLIKRKEQAIYKAIERKVKKVKDVYNSGELLSVKISVEWKANRTWGANPTAEAWATYKDDNGNTQHLYVKSGSIGGCGYDKLSTAVADVLNQIPAILKMLYKEKDKDTTANNHNLLGYGSGYGLLPSIEGGVGVSCYPRIFEKLGYNFNTVASGKTFDVFTISK